ncbi:bacteriohopanetetrol glucosamine biosynthesis glycosyltransferase HpnI [Enterovirga aerilata]|uniref:Glycosyltransferase n=1 Tax=Enterovirga aerilata TaxID=2730920 RepID=A0A849I377_9HYPH|nr:bacteriohopanetetrol glucosamine biosynthesis glycosyltransferase HpnI [Enterovirga sp. DB1703]NNM71818.1 glycosyltransferase [Enterovirga sp. DB1703]
MSFAEVLAGLLLLLSAAGLAYLVAAIVLVRRLAARPASSPGAAPSVTILKPLHGAEPGLFANLSTFLNQDYRGPVQIVFGVQDPRDPAIAVVRRLEAAFPQADIELVVDSRLHGSNRKVSNLINMAERTRHEIVVLADSDMIVGPGYLARLLGELERPGVGAVTCLYHGVPCGTLPSRLSALAIDSHFLPSVAVGLGLGLASPCMGSTIALRHETLEAIGGFRSLADDLADDYRLGAAVRRLGLAVAVTPFTIGHACNETSFADLARQELRWVRTIRQIDPFGHAGSVVSHPFPLAVLAFCIAPGAFAAGFAAAALALRIALCLAVRQAFGVKAGGYGLAPLRDLLSFGIFVASFFGRDVSWRGHSYDVTPAGVLMAKTRH